MLRSISLLFSLGSLVVSGQRYYQQPQVQSQLYAPQEQPQQRNRQPRYWQQDRQPTWQPRRFVWRPRRSMWRSRPRRHIWRPRRWKNRRAHQHWRPRRWGRRNYYQHRRSIADYYKRLYRQKLRAYFMNVRRYKRNSWQQPITYEPPATPEIPTPAPAPAVEIETPAPSTNIICDEEPEESGFHYAN